MCFNKENDVLKGKKGEKGRGEMEMNSLTAWQSFAETETKSQNV